MNEKNEITEIAISGEFIRLDALLKFASLTASGGEAKLRISGGEVRVNGAPCTQRGKKCHDGDLIELDGQAIRVKCS